MLDNENHYKSWPNTEYHAKNLPNIDTVANIFMCSFENKWFKDCLHGLKPVFYRQYGDDMFVLFSSLGHAETLNSFMMEAVII